MSTRRRVETTILDCLACPHCITADGVTRPGSGWYCETTGRAIPKVTHGYAIPDWCPLPIAVEVVKEDELD